MASYYGTENDDNILITSDAYDRVFGLGGDDTIEVSGVSYIVIYGDDGNDLIHSITSQLGLAIMYGGAGADTLIGGTGSNNFYIDEFDTIVETGGDDIVLVTFDFVLPDGFESVTAIGGSVSSLVGNDGDNRIFSYESLDGTELRGLAGNDWLHGGIFGDRLFGGAGSDLLEADAGADLLDGGAGADSLSGSGGNDTLRGGSGNDTIDGGGGRDLIDGGAGIDTVRYDFVGELIVVDLGAKVARFPTTTWGAESLASIENVWTGMVNDTLIGGSQANEIHGGMGNDRLVGGGGADVLAGGYANDVFAFGDGDSTPTARDTLKGDSDYFRAFDRPGEKFGDRIDLTALDADTTVAGLQDWTFGPAQGKGHVWATNVDGVTYIRGNSDGDAAIEFELAIEDSGIDASQYTVKDFIL